MKTPRTGGFAHFNN